ncbi:MmpS family transport accessory protein [Streptomyces sp. NPDC020965]|uniref:MmpS family transport accessory protein n=1 Tax=Streptomyces sp. NPDC020965 TaxID=3365105 RepID=UPI00379EDB36
MHRSIRTTAVTALTVAGLVFGLSACSEITEAGDAAKDKAVDQVDKTVNEKYDVTYEVTGKSVDSIQFAAGGGTALAPKMETVEKPVLPWKKTVTLRGILPPSVLPVALDATGDAQVTCKIIYKGKAIAEKSGEGLAAAGGCVAVSPIAE